ncbi:hypothetical protein VNO77_33331 [Canavalia gladiata]|uniref:Uncharacterized protein n=1 Tax=Canavalia gladiata TaxID=3824 RepID=A0AAN9KEI9_CANGL
MDTKEKDLCNRLACFEKEKRDLEEEINVQKALIECLTQRKDLVARGYSKNKGTAQVNHKTWQLCGD